MSPKYEPVPKAPQVPDRSASSRQPATEKAGSALVSMSVAVPTDLRRELRLLCVAQGVTVQTAVAEALSDWIAAHQADARA